MFFPKRKPFYAGSPNYPFPEFLDVFLVPDRNALEKLDSFSV